jgi:hypothetical protein
MIVNAIISHNCDVRSDTAVLPASLPIAESMRISSVEPLAPTSTCSVSAITTKEHAQQH